MTHVLLQAQLLALEELGAPALQLQAAARAVGGAVPAGAEQQWGEGGRPDLGGSTGGEGGVGVWGGLCGAEGPERQPQPHSPTPTPEQPYDPTAR